MKRLLSVLLVCVMVASLISGCGNQQASTTPTPAQSSAIASESPSSSPEATPLKAEITFWSFPNFKTIDDTIGKYEQQMIAAFNEKYPDIKVNMETIDFTSGPEKITNAIQGGTICDVILDAPGRIIQWGKDGVLADLNDMFTEDFIKDVNSNGIIGACKTGGNYYMYPMGQAPFLMAFSKEILEKHGLLNMLPMEGDRLWTLNQYEALLKALKEKGENGAVFYCSSQGGDQGTRAYIANLYNSKVIKDDLSAYTLNDEGGVKALEWTVKAIKEGWLQNGSASDGTASIDEFCQGRTTHSILFSAGLKNVKINMLEQSKTTPIYMPFPSANGTTSLEFLLNGWCIFDNGDANKIAAAKIFIDFCSNDAKWGPGNIKSTNTFPVRSSFGNLYPGDADMAYLAGLSKYYTTYYNTVNGFAQMRTAWFPALQAAIGGMKTPKEALDEYVQLANESLKAK